MTENSIILLRRNASDIWEQIVLPPTNDYFIGWNSSGVVVAKPGVALSAHETTHRAGGTDPLPWGNLIHASGLVAALPAASAANAGYFYYATDENSGTIYRSDGATWTKVTRGKGEVVLLTSANQTIFGNLNINGDLAVNLLGKVLKFSQGANASAGPATLVAGTVTVATTAVLTGDKIRVWAQDPGASSALGVIRIGTITNATSFVINSLKPADATVETGDISTVYWEITRAA